MKLKYILISLLVIFGLAACGQQALVEKSIPQEDIDFTKQYLALFRTRDFEAIEGKIVPKLKDAELRLKLRQMADSFPNDEPIDVLIVGAQTVTSGDMRLTKLSIQYEFPSKWLLANLTFRKKGDTVLVYAINVQLLNDSLKNINRFTFEGKGASNYIIFILAVLVPIFVIISLILCLRTPIPKRKWLWIIFIILGFVQYTVNWSTGGLNIDPLSFQLFGASFWKGGPYAPLFISVSTPIGAIVFLIMRKKWLIQAKGNEG